jgi:tetratricopeptide (TPR) repeat protein
VSVLPCRVWCAGFFILLACLQAAARAQDVSVPRLVSELAALVDAGELARAKTLVDEALHQHPSDGTLHNVAGVIEAQRGEYRSAERHFRAAIDRTPRAASAYLNLGRLYQEHADTDASAARQALIVYRQLLQIEPSHAEALFQAALLSAREGEWSASQTLLERLAPDARARPQALALLAASLMGLGKRVEAEEAAGRLLSHPDLVPEDVLAVLPALERRNASSLTERLLAGLDTRGVASAESLRQLGMLYARQERFSDARLVLERAVRIAGAARVPLLLDLARVAYKQRDFQGALGYLAHARDLEPKNAQVHFFFGLVSVELNLGAEAFESLKKAVMLAPDNPYVNYALGAVAIHRHEPSEALPYFEAYARLKPDDPRGRFALGAARFYANDLEGAKTALNEAVHAPETATGAHYFLGRIARQLNDLDGARRAIDRALALNPKHADAWAELGLLQTRARDYVGAEQSLARALDIDPENHAATVNLTALYGRMRHPRLDEQKARLEALQRKREAAAQEFLRMIEVVP